MLRRLDDSSHASRCRPPVLHLTWVALLVSIACGGGGSPPAGSSAAIETESSTPAGQTGDEGSGTPGSRPSAAGVVSGTIDETAYVWNVPDPDSDSCSIFGQIFRVDFSAADGSSRIQMGNAVVQVAFPDGNAYTAVRDPLNPGPFGDAISIDGDVVTYTGTLEFGPMQRAPGTATVEVDASISATCP